MARKQEFYKGRKKRRNYALIPFVIVLALIALIVVLFYSMQKYAVISKEGVTMVLPGDTPEDTVVDSSGNEIRVFDRVETDLVFDPPDYSRIEATAGRDAKPLRAIYIAAEDINTDHLMEMAARLSSGNALLLEMKPRAGALVWNSQATLAQRYGL